MTKLAWFASLMLSVAAVGCGDDTTTLSPNDLAVSGPFDMAHAAGDLAAASDAAGSATVKLEETDLTADGTNAANQDANLVNAWGLAFNPMGFVWISDNHSGKATVYDATGKPLALVVTVPVPTGGTPPSAPTGQVFNGVTADFNGDSFIFSTEDGTVSGWSAGTNATLRVDHSAAGTVYKGLAILAGNGVSRIYATDFHGGKVEVFDNNYAAVTLAANAFSDPGVPAGFAPFGIQSVGAQIVVTYAKQDAAMHDDVAGPGNGYVSLFDFDGALVKHLVSQGALNSPWGLAMAPASFGAASGMLLVGNFGDGKINAFDATSGQLAATIVDGTGAPLKIDGLWALEFGPGATGEATNQLFFTAGPGGEAHGLFGRLDLIP
ncbi:MAG TPA: TIGR03118 family protein [Polyangia bacterium]|nr:TIGR03118 family protein [Polyangia bacterium]